MDKLIAMERIDYEGDNTLRYARIMAYYYFECGNRYMLTLAVRLACISSKD